MSVTIRIKVSQNIEGNCLQQATDRAIQRSMMKVFTSTKAEWSRMIHKEIYLSIGQIKSAIKMKESKTQADIVVDSTTAGFLTSRKRRPSLPVKYFTPKQDRTGVSVAIKRSKGREHIAHAFMWRGHVWRRAESGQGLVKRLPIEMKYTTAIEDVASDHLPEIERFAQKRLEQVFVRQLNYEVSKC